jgi:hypothetical protein
MNGFIPTCLIQNPFWLNEWTVLEPILPFGEIYLKRIKAISSWEWFLKCLRKGPLRSYWFSYYKITLHNHVPYLMGLNTPICFLISLYASNLSGHYFFAWRHRGMFVITAYFGGVWYRIYSNSDIMLNWFACSNSICCLKITFDVFPFNCTHFLS